MIRRSVPAATAIILVGLLGLMLLGCGGEKPLAFTVTFEDARDLRPGQFLVYKGIRLGEVTAVGLDQGGSVKVDITINHEYRKTVYREAEFMIEKPSGMIDVSGERQVTMYDRSGPHSLLDGGEIIVGSDGTLDHWMNRLSDAGKSLWYGTQQLYGDVKNMLGTQDSVVTGQEFLRSLDDYKQQARDLTKENFEIYSRQTLPELQKQARELRESLEKQGKRDEAKKFWQDFSDWAEKLKH